LLLLDSSKASMREQKLVICKGMYQEGALALLAISVAFAFLSSKEDAQSLSKKAYVRGPHARDFMRGVNANISNFIGWLRASPALLTDPRWRRLTQRYTGEIEPMSEGSGAAFTRDKRHIKLCVPKSVEERDQQAAVFVTLHELAHVANASWGHKEDFWETFRDLLGLAVRSGIYTKRSYADNPVSFCGQEIQSQPLDQ
jgi:hypothetical protein